MFTVFMFFVCICLGAVAASLAYALYSDLKQEREETAAHPHGLQGWEHEDVLHGDSREEIKL